MLGSPLQDPGQLRCFAAGQPVIVKQGRNSCRPSLHLCGLGAKPDPINPEVGFHPQYYQWVTSRALLIRDGAAVQTCAHEAFEAEHVVLARLGPVT